MAERCATCMFFVNGSTSDVGECRQQPPVVGLLGTSWPAVSGSAWCGEYAKTPRPQDYETTSRTPQE